MNTSAIDILELYIKGKDCDQHQILEQIYAANSTVTFEISSPDISFPEQIVGNQEIAKVLSLDFNQKYEDVKTYYLSKPEADQKQIVGQKWLVIMRDIEQQVTRVGTGYYNWTLVELDGELKIQAHTIYIKEMLELPDPDCKLLQSLQEQLEYPFVDPESVTNLVTRYPELAEIKRYINQDK